MKEITVENLPVPAQRVGAVWGSILRHPSQLLARWNYKSAIFSSTMRASIFLLTYLQFRQAHMDAQESILIAFGAAAAQFVYRFIFAGINGSLIQSFRRVEPAWQAMLTIMLVIPVVSHILEFIVQHTYAYFTQTTSNTDEAIVRSISVSIISGIFNLFVMRRGLLLVGEKEEQKTLWGDIKHFPRVTAEFIGFITMELFKMIRRGQIVGAVLGVLGFGVFAAIIGWAIKGKQSWVLPWGTGAIIVLLVGMGIAAIALSRKEQKA